MVLIDCLDNLVHANEPGNITLARMLHKQTGIVTVISPTTICSLGKYKLNIIIILWVEMVGHDGNQPHMI